MPAEPPHSEGLSETPDGAATPGAHDGALFDWAQQIPEWGAAAPVARPRPQPDAGRPRADADRPRAVTVPRRGAVELWHERLTRRGRIVALSAASVLATAVLAGLFVAVASAGVSASGASTQAALTEAPATVVVRDGDTLWTIAERVRPDDDPRSTVFEIARENGLSGAEVEPGQELVLPDF